MLRVVFLASLTLVTISAVRGGSVALIKLLTYRQHLLGVGLRLLFVILRAFSRQVIQAALRQCEQCGRGEVWLKDMVQSDGTVGYGPIFVGGS